MNTIRVSGWKIAQHYLFTSLRKLISKGDDKVLDKILEQKAATKKSFGALVLFLIITSIWLSTTPLDSINIKIRYFDIEIAKINVLFLSSMLMALTYSNFCSFMFLHGATLRLLKYKYGYDFNYYNVIYDGDSAWALPFFSKFSFLKPNYSFGINSLIGIILYAIPLITIVISIYFSLIFQVLSFFLKKSATAYELIISCASAGFLIFCLFHFFHLLFPYKFTKNLLYTRWGFWLDIAESEKRNPARLATWLDEDQSKNGMKKGLSP